MKEEDPGSLPSSRQARRAGRVLVVDDQPELARSIARLMQSLGYEARYVVDPTLAIEAAKEFRPDVALLDIHMPQIDGCELARMIRADEDLRNMRLIAVTADADPRCRARTREAGFDAHVGKPIDVDGLQSLITQVEGT